MKEHVHVYLAGPLSTTLDRSKIGQEEAQDLLNCNTDDRTWRLDDRYRQFAPAPDTDPQGCGIGLAAQGKVILAIHDGVPRLINASEMTNSDGTVSAFTAVTVDGSVTLADGEWTFWQHQNVLFCANPDGGVWYLIIGESRLRQLYLDYDLTGGGAAQMDIPPYSTYAFASPDTINSGTGHSGGDFSLEGDAIKMYDPWDPTGYNDTYHRALYTFNTAVDWSRHDYLMMRASTLQGNYWADTVPDFAIMNATYSTEAEARRAVVRRVLNAARTVMYIWIDMTGISRSDRTAITDFYLGLTMRRDGPDGFVITPVQLGGVFLQAQGSQSAIEQSSSTGAELPDIEYAYSYFAGVSLTESSATVVTLRGELAIGQKIDIGLPHGGGWSKIVAPIQGSPPYNEAGSKVRFYRKVGSSWYRIDDNSINNTGAGTVNWVDKRTAEEVAALSVATPTFGDIDPSASGAVLGVQNGFSWRGSNVYLGTNGKVYFSRVNNFKDVLWDQITIDSARDEDLARPRTLLGDPMFNEPLLCGASNDAAYLFTRHLGYAITGDLPSQASMPRNLPFVQGALGKHSCCAYLNGCLVASDSGLWYVAVPSAYTGALSPATKEMTEAIRPTWEWLIGDVTEREATIVRSINDEIWVFNGNRALHLTRQRSWVKVEWEGNAEVVSAVVSEEYGLGLLFADGTMGRIGRYLTDGGTNANGTNGDEVSWWWVGRREMYDAHLLFAECCYEPDTPTDIYVEATSQRAAAQTLPMVGADGYDKKPFARASNPGGKWFEIKVGGTGSDVVTSLRVFTSIASDGRTQT